MKFDKDYPILCLDFDGVLHSYTSGWKGPRTIPDPPVDGSIEWLRSLLGCPDNEGIAERYRGFKVAIYSARSQFIGGRGAIKRWLMRWGMTKYEIELIHFPRSKPPAFVTLDDRAITFTGIFPSETEMLAFKPWNKQSV